MTYAKKRANHGSKSTDERTLLSIAARSRSLATNALRPDHAGRNDPLPSSSTKPNSRAAFNVSLALLLALVRPDNPFGCRSLRIASRSSFLDRITFTNSSRTSMRVGVVVVSVNILRALKLQRRRRLDSRKTNSQIHQTNAPHCLA